jgi:hypothetical protein
MFLRINGWELNAGIDFLEFRPSEIAASVAISVSRQMQAEVIDKAMSCFIHVEKVKWGGAHRNKTRTGQIIFCS